MRVQLGNPAPKEAYRDAKGKLLHRDLDGPRVTTVVIPDTYTLLEAVAAVTAQDGAWNHHSQGDVPADTSPEWVDSDREGLAQMLAEHFECRRGRPKGWKDITETGEKGD